MTARGIYTASIGLFALLGCGIGDTIWFTNEVGDTGLHGPVGLVVALPFVLLFAIGALILAVLALKAWLGALPTAVGLLPAFAIAISAFGLALLSLAR